MFYIVMLVCFSLPTFVKQERRDECKIIHQSHFLDEENLQDENEVLSRSINVREAPEKGKNATCLDMHKTNASPFIAIILKRTSGQFLCMGSILDDKSVLSAKNCFEGEEKDDNDYYVLAGYLKSYWGRHSQVKKVDKIIKNENLVILKLKHPLEFGKTVKKVKLPMSNFTAMLPSRDVGCEVGIYGFPVEKWNTPGDALPKSGTYILKGVQVVATTDCETVYKDKLAPTVKTIVSDNFSCLKGKTNFCWGTMGSPVVVRHEKGIMQLGVIIMANCDETEDYPMLNVRLVHQLKWIESNSGK